MIVDIHAHLFNADDLPVAGFVSHHESVRDIIGTRALARFLDRIVQDRAPGYESDRHRLNALISGLETSVEDPEESLAAEEEAARAELEADPALKSEVEASMARYDAETGEVPEESFSLGDVARAIRWVALFKQSRVDLPGQYAASSGAGVTLVVPMMVDLDAGTEDEAPTSQARQVELFDLVSQAATLGLLPRAGALAVHPFVAFDPVRQLRHIGNDESPLDLVHRAVQSHGFIGVKVYPPMGWRPTGNTGRADLSERDGRRLDEIVVELARWCEASDVPITTHCSDSNYANKRYQDFGEPLRWQGLLDEFPSLRLNLGHFGGIHREPADYNWTKEIAGLMQRYEFVYADVSCQRVDVDDLVATQMAVVRGLHQSGYPVLDRVMMGTDWYMQALNPQPEHFVETYRTVWADTFGDAAADNFAAINALHFLGLDEPANQNAQRLALRYHDLGVARPGWLAS